MTLFARPDWDDAFANAPYIADGALYPARWAAQAAAFRDITPPASRHRYDADPACWFDLFRPKATPPKGVLIFVHGGYWKAFSPDMWSHLAAGPLGAGWAVAMPGYTLAPQADIPTMTRQIARAVGMIAEQFTEQSSGPIHLAGHSAGGHLVLRMACAPAMLPADLQARIGRITSISGLHDLRPLLQTRMNEVLGLTPDSAARESPALLHPVPDPAISLWVGADERPEFLRQAHLLHDIWAAKDCDIDLVIAPDCHHFDVIDGLTDAASPLTQAVLRGRGAPILAPMT